MPRPLATTDASPGPTLRLRAGDVLRIRLLNRLAEPTNLHMHGLHVSPQGAGDNVFVTVDPGGSFDYEYRLPADHPPGVYWYHPHLHGLVAGQVFGGLFGAIVVEDTDPSRPPWTVFQEPHHGTPAQQPGADQGIRESKPARDAARTMREAGRLPAAVPATAAPPRTTTRCTATASMPGTVSRCSGTGSG